MKIDFATLAFGYTVRAGGGTPNWATSLGQGKEYRINESPDINELLKGLIYSSISLSKVTSKIGKGGRTVSANADDSPIITASLFNKVYVNDRLIPGGKYILIVTRDTSKSHAGRLRVKYGPSNAYHEEGQEYSNETFWSEAKEHLGLSEEACFFVYDISIENQSNLILHTIVVNKYSSMSYSDSVALHAAWDPLIEEDEKRRGIEPIVISEEEESESSLSDHDDLTPQWFEEKAVAFPTLDDEAQKFLFKFRMIFSPEKLRDLSGKELLNYIFLNNENKTNLCYILEFDNECRTIFGSIKSGTSYKYGLHYSKKNNSWATGSSVKKTLLSEEEAIELGTQIRDYLLDGVEIIQATGEVHTLEEYNSLYNDLYDITDGYINRVWFMKYYALLFPDVFPPIYSYNAQCTVLHRLHISPGDNPIYRLGQIRNYADECNISNVMFSRIFWTYCNNDTNEENDQGDDTELKNCLEISKEPRKDTLHPLNSIVYGAPGTGKTYSMIDYALAIIDNVSLEDFRKNNADRKANVNRYKALVKEGRIVFTTFHQNYGYEEFIQGLRPDKNSESLAFATIDGVFKTIADNALNDAENRNYVIIIDEINRANISKVFGELITLIEPDKRWGEINETSVTLQSGAPFAVPNNLYIIGTMNSADKSISLIDAALRRRFVFVEQKPDFSLVPKGVLQKLFISLNENLVSELDSTDLLIGHSYFMNKTESDICEILNCNIIPLLYEYFYDNKKKVAAILEKAITASGANINIVDEKMGRLRVENKVG